MEAARRMGGGKWLGRWEVMGGRTDRQTGGGQMEEWLRRVESGWTCGEWGSEVGGWKGGLTGDTGF